MILGVLYDAEIEYLESTGTQWIDTGILASSEVGIKVEVDNVQLNRWICGGRTAYHNSAIGFYLLSNGMLRCSYGSEDNETQLDLARHTLEITNAKYYIDGVLKHTFSQQSFSSQSKIYLYNLSVNAEGTISNIGMIGRIYYCKIYSGSTLVRDFIPVRVGQTGYMYDRVTRRLFGNKGTGSFVLGPDVAKPVMGLYGMRKFYNASDYVQDGLVAMWDGIENAGWRTHDGIATVWKDLVGGIELPIMAGGSWEDDCIVGDGTAPAAGTNNGPSGTLKQPFAEVVYHTLAAPARNQVVVSFGLKYSGSENYYKVFGLSDSYGTVYFDANSRLARVTGDTYLSAHTVSMASTARGTNQGYYVDGVARSRSGGDGSGSFNKGIFVCAMANSGVGWMQPTKSKVHCIRFYSRVLTADEIAHNYAIDKARFNLP